eukprot:COSAG05_NODE_19544_length_291_cov_0.557292_1_plen_93_part_10
MDVAPPPEVQPEEPKREPRADDDDVEMVDVVTPADKDKKARDDAIIIDGGDDGGTPLPAGGDDGGTPFDQPTPVPEVPKKPKKKPKTQRGGGK